MVRESEEIIEVENHIRGIVTTSIIRFELSGRNARRIGRHGILVAVWNHIALRRSFGWIRYGTYITLLA
jgi:hypothetical protein